MPIVALPQSGVQIDDTFLALVQSLHRAGRMTGQAPTTVVGQTGDAASLVDWIRRSWLEIQSSQKTWKWMRKSVTFATIANQAVYTPEQAGVPEKAVKTWMLDTFRIYPTGQTASEIPLARMDYDVWRDTFQLGAMRDVRTQPWVIAEDEAHGLCLGPTPPAGFTIVGDYYKIPQVLIADEDKTDLPLQHSPMIIVYKALLDYGASIAAPEVYQRAMNKYGQLYADLRVDQLPRLSFGGPLA